MKRFTFFKNVTPKYPPKSLKLPTQKNEVPFTNPQRGEFKKPSDNFSVLPDSAAMFQSLKDAYETTRDTAKFVRDAVDSITSFRQ